MQGRHSVNSKSQPKLGRTRMTQSSRLLPSLTKTKGRPRGEKEGGDMGVDSVTEAQLHKISMRKARAQQGGLTGDIEYLHSLLNDVSGDTPSLKQHYIWRYVTESMGHLQANGRKAQAHIAALTAEVADHTSERESLELELQRLQGAMRVLDFDKWGSEAKLRQGIKDLETQIEEVCLSQETAQSILFHVPENVGQNSFMNLINRKHTRFDQLIFVLKTRLAGLQKYKRQQEVESRFGGVPQLLEAHDKLQAQNEKLRLREIRFSHDALLKRRPISILPQEFTMSLVIGLQNELAAFKECWRAVEEHADSKMVDEVIASSYVNGLVEGKGAQTGAEAQEETQRKNLDVTFRRKEQTKRTNTVKLYDALAAGKAAGQTENEKNALFLLDKEKVKNSSLTNQISRLQFQVKQLSANLPNAKGLSPRYVRLAKTMSGDSEVVEKLAALAAVKPHDLEHKNQTYLLAMLKEYSKAIRSSQKHLSDMGEMLAERTDELSRARSGRAQYKLVLGSLLKDSPYLYEQVLKSKFGPTLMDSQPDSFTLGSNADTAKQKLADLHAGVDAVITKLRVLREERRPMLDIQSPKGLSLGRKSNRNKKSGRISSIAGSIKSSRRSSVASVKSPGPGSSRGV